MKTFSRQGGHTALDFFDELERRIGDETGLAQAAEERPSTPEELRSLLLQAKLFDGEWYVRAYPDVGEAGADPFEHYITTGAFSGRRPNPYFDAAWYLATYADIRQAGIEPLTHYVLIGEREGRRPTPIFDPVWYRERYRIEGQGLAFAHFLAHRTTGQVSPLPEFDAEYYYHTYPDIAAAAIDPFEHYINAGFREGRNPSADFDTRFYIKRYLGGSTAECPLFHFIAHKHEPGVHGRMPEDEVSIPREIKRFTKPGPDFEEFKPVAAVSEPRVKLLAYYLPQFHAFPENDAWWGKGFTEWSNLPRGIPRFAGHYQPRVPRDLGFYTLETNEALRRQVKMAQDAGVFGFVFYYYWFNGRRIMDAPMERFLDDPSIEMPFCVMWANENWTRRWDGAESEVLISQDYLEDDDARLVADFGRHFQDPRYIRVQGRPLLMIYRPRLIPDTVETLARWRAMFQEQFDEDPIIVMAQSFNDTDPRVFGLDGAIEFPPHKLTAAIPSIANNLQILDPEFDGRVYHYDDVVRVSLEDAPSASFPLIKTAVPSWDNDARRQGSGLTLIGSTPAKYETWLNQLIDQANTTPFFGEAFVCVNAWNEWCEGAYLEPDLHYGAAYLNATSRAVTGVSQRTNSRVVLIGHDAFPSGAQQLLLNIGHDLRARHGVEIAFLLLGGGKLQDAYAALAPTTVAGSDQEALRRLRELHERGFTSAIVNTTAAARIIPGAKTLGFDTHLLVHELPRIIREKNLAAGAKAGLAAATSVVFPAPYVRDKVTEALDIAVDSRMRIIQNGLYKKVSFSAEAAAQVRTELGLTADDCLVLGMGYADMRKGFDLFLSLWRMLQAPSATSNQPGRMHFCWVGGMDPQLEDWLGIELADAKATGTFHLAGYQTAVESYLSAADAFVLTSREDPFPSVVLEALSTGTPVVAFDRSGGIPDMLRETGFGAVAPHGDVDAMARALVELTKEPRSLEARREQQEQAQQAFAFAPYVQHLLRLVLPGLQKVSVAVPNYNYARFVADRLGSVFGQSYPVHEVIVLDDCSTDDSIPVIRQVSGEWRRYIQLVPNEENSGWVFAQWRKAAELATGDYLWIAEADDFAEPAFLAEIMTAMEEDPSIVLGFSDSRTITSDGLPQWDSYKSYYATVQPGALSHSGVFDGDEFVRRFMSVKNLILNVSAVVWRRDALLRALDRCEDDLATFRMAGDWRLYLEVLSEPGAKVAYEAMSLNVHRRHAESVTHSMRADKHVAEIEGIQELVAQAFDLPKTIQRAQQSYLAEVTDQLKAKRPADAEPEPDPALNKPRRVFRVVKQTNN
ncbi:glycoside hydrolase family 99-like domain-containing protein [Microvirga soli]|uniref:glycoside hydrolase family 99-like domain-containing protein n=1 Tax=Microvirga soli TaxID=1854496 RepID=UPI00191F4FCB|nr:glycoside hydrolase family 99-like domain-containing protein [Microvirga soli]